jgi:hypothetical protein
MVGRGKLKCPDISQLAAGDFDLAENGSSLG